MAIFGMVPICGAIVTRASGDFNPQRVTTARVHGGDPPTRGPRRSGLVYSTTAFAHEGLALLTVDLHEVDDLLALTNILVQLHNMK